jgi:hypothetical protein
VQGPHLASGAGCGNLRAAMTRATWITALAFLALGACDADDT